MMYFFLLENTKIGFLGFWFQKFEIPLDAPFQVKNKTQEPGEIKF